MGFGITDLAASANASTPIAMARVSTLQRMCFYRRSYLCKWGPPHYNRGLVVLSTTEPADAAFTGILVATFARAGYPFAVAIRSAG